MAAPRTEPGRAGPAAAFDATVTGRVQGVGFRYCACREADRLGLTGWVRNSDEGDVEVHAEGAPANPSTPSPAGSIPAPPAPAWKPSTSSPARP